jgi:6,7-dimethyl-8-ribityllumazine synthase
LGTQQEQPMSDLPHVMIVEGRFYKDVADALAASAIGVVEAAGASYDRYEVPGAFEVPAAIRFAIRGMDFYSARRRYDGYIALGCVIRGETSHYDYVCQESARALQDLAMRYSLALGYGILTVETMDQAIERARRDGKDRGGHAARACLAMIELKKSFHLFPR